MAKMSEDEVLNEIQKLLKSPYVKLARDTNNKALKQKLYALRSLDKKGREIAEIIKGAEKFEQSIRSETGAAVNKTAEKQLAGRRS